MMIFEEISGKEGSVEVKKYVNSIGCFDSDNIRHSGLFFQSKICAHIVYSNMQTSDRDNSRNQGAAYRHFSRFRYR